MSDPKIQLIRRLYDEVLNNQAWSALNQIYTADAVFHDPAQPQITSLEHMERWAASLRGSYPDLQYDVMDTMIAGDRGAVRWLASATHTQEEQGTLVETEGMTMFRFHEDQIADQTQIWSPLLPEEAEERRAYRPEENHVPTTLTPEQRKFLMEHWWNEGLSKGHFDLIHQVFDQNATLRNTGTTTIRGANTLLDYMTAFHAPYEEHPYTVRDLIYTRDTTVLYWSAALVQGKHKSSEEESEERITGEGVFWVRYRGDKVIECWQIFAVNAPDGG